MKNTLKDIKKRITWLESANMTQAKINAVILTRIENNSSAFLNLTVIVIILVIAIILGVVLYV